MGTVVSRNILLVGPSGGGKTTLLRSLKARHTVAGPKTGPSEVYNFERVKYSLDSTRFYFQVFDLPGACGCAVFEYQKAASPPGVPPAAH
jgi:GTPase SAR1 family protein